MPSILRLFNTAGRLQLDATAPALQFKQAINSVDSFRYERCFGEKLSYAWAPSAFSLMAVRPSGGSITQMGLIGGGAPGYQFATLTSTTTIQGFLFERPFIQAATSGVVVYLKDEAGNVTYSMGQLPMRVVAVLPTSGGGFPQTEFVGTPGRIYAAAFPGYIGYFGWEPADFILQGGQPTIPPDGEQWYRFVGAGAAIEVDPAQPHKLLFTSLQHSGTNHGTTQSPPNGGGSYNGTVLIVDVTGL